MDNPFEFEKELQIDPDALDVNWLEQPSLLFRYASFLNEAEIDLEQIKNELEVLKSDLSIKIRSNPGQYGIDKVTEGAITAAILSDNSYQLKYQAYLNTKENVGMLKAAVYAINQRKDALENLVRLHGQQYFSSPLIDISLSDRYKEKQVKKEVAKNKIKRRLNETTKEK
jgi:hypothetical protein